MGQDNRAGLLSNDRSLIRTPPAGEPPVVKLQSHPSSVPMVMSGHSPRQTIWTLKQCPLNHFQDRHFISRVPNFPQVTNYAVSCPASLLIKIDHYFPSNRNSCAYSYTHVILILSAKPHKYNCHLYQIPITEQGEFSAQTHRIYISHVSPAAVPTILTSAMLILFFWTAHHPFSLMNNGNTSVQASVHRTIILSSSTDTHHVLRILPEHHCPTPHCLLVITLQQTCPIIQKYTWREHRQKGILGNLNSKVASLRQFQMAQHIAARPKL